MFQRHLTHPQGTLHKIWLKSCMLCCFSLYTKSNLIIRFTHTHTHTYIYIYIYIYIGKDTKGIEVQVDVCKQRKTTTK